MIVFIIYYKYIKIVGVKFNSISNIFTYTKILIVCNVFNLTILYAVQFLNKPPVSVWYALISEREGKTLELLGFFLFNEKYDQQLLPNFIMFILSLALHTEISRQIKLNTKDANIKHEIEKNMMLYHTESVSSLNIEKNETDSKKVKLLDDYLKIDNNDNNININDNLKYNRTSSKSSSISDREFKEEKRKKLEERIRENQRVKYIIKKLFIILYYILHYYWIIIFFFIAILCIHWMLSVSMVIQLTIFCYYILKSFRQYSSFLKNQDDVDNLSLNQN
jgi:ABC-type multidrug transport system fused ATPase/permease subunit